MRFFQELIKGFTAYSQALPFINQHKLWGYVLLPAIINLLLFFGAGLFIWHYSSLAGAWVIDVIGIDTLTGFMGEALGWLVFIVVKILSFFLYFKFYRYAILLLSAPALALIAEKTQEISTGVSHPFSAKQLLHDTIRGLGITLRNLLIELSVTIPLYLLALIPIITPFATVLILLIESYFVGFSMIDYRNEYLRLSAANSRRLINKHRGLAIGNGLVFSLLLLIPFIGVLIAPPMGVIAGGLAANQVLNEKADLISNHR